MLTHTKEWIIRCHNRAAPEKLTLSLSSVFCEVREAIEIVSGWLLPSPWLSRSSPSLQIIHFFFITTLALNFWCVRSYSIQGAPQYCGKRYKLDKITDAQVKNSTLNSFFYRHSFVQWQHCIEFNTTNQSGLWHIRNKSKARKQTAQPHI